MGAKNSKDVTIKKDSVPNKFTTGCITAGESRDWRNDNNYKNVSNKLIKAQSLKTNNKDIPAKPSTSNLEDIAIRGPCRLQSIGQNKKSYLQQLLQHRAKDGADATVTTKALERGDPQKTIKENGYQMTVSKIYNKKGVFTILKAFVTGKEENLIREVLNSNQQKVSKPPSNPPVNINSSTGNPLLQKQFDNQPQNNSLQMRILRTKPSRICNKSKDDSLGEHAIPRKCSRKNSDVSVMSYNRAKARFENGLEKKTAGRNEAFKQLEALGLGYWKDDQWVPTKVVTPAITGQLSCSDKDLTNSFSFKANYSSTQTGCSEVNK